MAQLRGLLVLVVGYLLARYALPAMYPLLLAAALAIAVEPLVGRLVAAGMSRTWAAPLGLLALGTLLMVGTFLLVRSVALEALHMAQGLPGAARNALAHLRSVWPEHWLGAAPSLPVHVLGQLTSGIGHAAAQLPDLSLAAIVAAMGAYLMARDLPVLRRRMREDLPALMPRGSIEVGRVAWRATVRYLRAQLVLASVTASVTGLGLLIVGAPYALLAALGVGLLDIAPAIGPATILAPWAIVALLVGNTGLGLRIGIVLAVAMLVRPVLEPRFVGGQVGLHPLATLVSMYLGLRLFGAPGIAIGPVLAATAWAAYLGEAAR